MVNTNLVEHLMFFTNQQLQTNDKDHLEGGIKDSSSLVLECVYIVQCTMPCMTYSKYVSYHMFTLIPIEMTRSQYS